MCLAIEFQTLLQELVLFLLVEELSSVILEKLEQGLKEGLKAAVQEVEEQFGQPGGLKSKLEGLEPRLLDESLIHDLVGMFIGAVLSMIDLTISWLLFLFFAFTFKTTILSLS